MLDALPLPSAHDPTESPHEALRAVERAADAVPSARELAQAVLALQARVTAEDGLAPMIAGVHRGELVRWDAWTTTWTGSRPETGEAVMLRTLRPVAARDPVLRRALLREARALGPVVPGLRVHDGPLPAVVAALRGEPLDAALDLGSGLDGPGVALAAQTAVRAVDAWTRGGLGLPVLAPIELRRIRQGLMICCLTPTPEPDFRRPFHDIAVRIMRVAAPPLTAVVEILGGFATLPPHDADEALLWLRGAQLHDATAEAHAKRLRELRTEHTERSERLLAAARALTEALPPPQGRAAVGIDLEGRVTVVHTRGVEVWWGPEGPNAPPPVRIHGADGFDPPVARRLLRSRAVTPDIARLQARVQGDLDYVEAIGRWIAAGLKLRTVRLLLERAPSTRG